MRHPERDSPSLSLRLLWDVSARMSIFDSTPLPIPTATRDSLDLSDFSRLVTSRSAMEESRLLTVSAICIIIVMENT